MSAIRPGRLSVGSSALRSLGSARIGGVGSRHLQVSRPGELRQTGVLLVAHRVLLVGGGHAAPRPHNLTPRLGARNIGRVMADASQQRGAANANQDLAPTTPPVTQPSPQAGSPTSRLMSGAKRVLVGGRESRPGEGRRRSARSECRRRTHEPRAGRRVKALVPVGRPGARRSGVSRLPLGRSGSRERDRPTRLGLASALVAERSSDAAGARDPHVARSARRVRLGRDAKAIAQARLNDTIGLYLEERRIRTRTKRSLYLPHQSARN